MSCIRSRFIVGSRRNLSTIVTQRFNLLEISTSRSTSGARVNSRVFTASIGLTYRLRYLRTTSAAAKKSSSDASPRPNRRMLDPALLTALFDTTCIRLIVLVFTKRWGGCPLTQHPPHLYLQCRASTVRGPCATVQQRNVKAAGLIRLDQPSSPHAPRLGVMVGWGRFLLCPDACGDVVLSPHLSASVSSRNTVQRGRQTTRSRPSVNLPPIAGRSVSADFNGRGVTQGLRV